MGSILILTGRDDITADAVIDELTSRDEQVVRFDTADFPLSSRLTATLGSAGWTGALSTHSQAGDSLGRRVDLGSVKSVWWRRPNQFRTPDGWSATAAAYAVSEARAGLLGVLGSLPARWINHPADDAAANYKPHQLATAARAGLRVPRSIVTSDPDQARAFVGADTVIHKPLGGGVLDTSDGSRQFLPVTLVSAGDLDDGVAGTTHLFQERVPKAFEVRLTVIGDRMFPVAIHAGSEAARLDWRSDYRSLTYEQIEMPEDVATGVRRLMNELRLYFGALDFAVTPEGEWVFFEVNPNGQWHWLTARAGVRLVEAMADALAHSNEPEAAGSPSQGAS